VKTLPDLESSKQLMLAVEGLPPERLRNLQDERLRAVVKRAYETVETYRRKWDEAGVKVDEIRGIGDLPMLPFLEKDDFREAYPFGLFSAPLTEIVEIHASSGTTGKPTVVGYTRGDIEIWGEVMGRTFAAGGVGTNDILQNAYGYGLFTGGLGGHYGASKVGASVIPMSTGNTRRQLQILQDFGTTAICCTPSYAILLGEAGREIGMNFEELPLRVGFFGAEPWSESMRAEIERLLVLEALDIYGLSEVIGPGVAYECLAQQGLHIAEDHFFPEIINPQTLEYVPDGTHGELVFTTLTKTGLPLIRYRTRDITKLHPGDCPCGRTLRRMAKISGRTDDMLIIRGVNVFPSQIEQVLGEVEETEPHYQLVVDREHGHMDNVELWVEVSESVVSDEVRHLEVLERKIGKELESVLGLSVKIRLVEPKSITRSEGKAKRVVDRRDLGL
jgi:phenylacetate-CoA ligase